MNNFVSQDSRIERLFASIDQNMDEAEQSGSTPLFFSQTCHNQTLRSTETSPDSAQTPVVSTFA
jgi:hypothetical protein